MWNVSGRFLDALRLPHTAVSQVSVFRGGALILDDLPISSGSVTVDEGSQVRRTASLEVADPDLDPSDVSDLLAPIGTEVLISRGIEFGAGDRELVPLGVFRVRSATRSSWLGGVQVTADDRSKAVTDARLEIPWNTPWYGYVSEEIKRLVLAATPNVEVYDLTYSVGQTTSGVFETDRWKAIETLAKSIGAEVVFDPLGRCVIRPVVTDVGAPVWTIDAGPHGVMVDVSTGLSSENLYNAIIATGQTQDNTPPVFGGAFINDGDFRWNGPLGRIPKFYSSSFLTTVDQAETAARAILARAPLLQRVVEPTAIVNPALDIGDTVDLVLPDGSTYRQIIRNLVIPLDETGTMSVATRAPGVISEDLS